MKKPRMSKRRIKKFEKKMIQMDSEFKMGTAEFDQLRKQINIYMNEVLRNSNGC